MKKTQFLFLYLASILFSVAAFSQKYKTADDTTKLNKEWMETNNDIAELQYKLTIASNKMPGYVKEAGNANYKAQTAVGKSSEQAAKANNGDMGDIKNAKKKASKALSQAEDAKDANEKVQDQDKKINNLNKELQKKQEKLQKLEEMRTAIRNIPGQ